jgi:hypothetical protein
LTEGLHCSIYIRAKTDDKGLTYPRKICSIQLETYTSAKAPRIPTDQRPQKHAYDMTRNPECNPE